MFSMPDQELFNNGDRSLGKPNIIRGPDDKISQAIGGGDRKNANKDLLTLKLGVDCLKGKSLGAYRDLAVWGDLYFAKAAKEEPSVSEGVLMGKVATRLQGERKEGVI